MKTKKFTRASLKSFIRKHGSELYVNHKSSFSGMTDGVEPLKGGFEPVRATTGNLGHTLGIAGLWLVGGSRDYFTPYEDDLYAGWRIYNSCGCSILGIPKNLSHE